MADGGLSALGSLVVEGCRAGRELECRLRLASEASLLSVLADLMQSGWQLSPFQLAHDVYYRDGVVAERSCAIGITPAPGRRSELCERELRSDASGVSLTRRCRSSVVAPDRLELEDQTKARLRTLELGGWQWHLNEETVLARGGLVAGDQPPGVRWLSASAELAPPVDVQSVRITLRSCSVSPCGLWRVDAGFSFQGDRASAESAARAWVNPVCVLEMELLPRAGLDASEAARRGLGYASAMLAASRRCG